MNRDEQMLLSEILSTIDSYDMHKAKNGKTINIQFISKDKSCTSCDRKSFKNYESTIKYLQKCVLSEEGEVNNG